MTQEDKMEFINSIMAHGGTLKSISKDKGTPQILVGYKGVNYLVYFSDQKCQELDAYVDQWQGLIVEIASTSDIRKIIGDS